jgi:electron transport complex protein RnfG
MHKVGATRGLLTLLAVALTAGLLVAFSDLVSRERIAANERSYLLGQLSQVVNPDLYDNDLAASRIQVQDSDLLGLDDATDVYVGTRAGTPVAFLFIANARDGYNGNIGLLVGITHDGRITGVRVTAHRETPGLGDGIEASKSDWIESFAGRSLGDPSVSGWTVRAHGGEFHQLTGATITPRAVIKAVRNTLVFFADNRAALMDSHPADTVETP